MAGLIELLFIVGLLFWFWSSQRSALRRNPDAGRGAQTDSRSQSTSELPSASVRASRRD